MLSIKETATLLKDTFIKFIDDRGIKLSAALAYYTIFSLPPLLILITAVTGFFYGQDAIEGRIYFQIQGMVGKEAALQVQEAIKNTTIDNNSNWATIVSIIALLFGATGVFSEIQDSINVIWGLKAKPKKGFIKLVINRLISFSMIITIGFLLLVSLILNALIDLFNERLQLLFPDLAVITFYVFNQLFMLSIITSLFITVFKVLPDAKINWRDVFVGSIFTSILFMAGKWIIGLYLGGSDVATAYGAAGSVIVILLWVYYSSIILFLGAEFTQIYALRHGKTIQPSDYAVFVVQKTEEITNPKDS
ncbi:MAG: YihY/virulence factor BrkB family protein [Bacteroidetes bacterium]|nr:YihY/virulence factor BrkB family protein [Bacteroidota bacterium]MBK7971134.1 YihY/virulence factor BrkB family protein [Bacteroidota bacterium]MBK8415549.1 YihY/virulence factor BrkB family protein [Bacteroidota bacterium]MBK8872512.1 YihY/virulence factor BrkB family protein [Bacteroidota bacterium]MBK9422545.1 YihY/virulence factor BrkB family protein [Bacteroidota bacterium]